MPTPHQPADAADDTLADAAELRAAKVRLVMLELQRRRLLGEIPQHADVCPGQMALVAQELGVSMDRTTLSRLVLRTLKKLRLTPEIQALDPKQS